jgi:uncharacterized protein YgbK (DUF1537 family)
MKKRENKIDYAFYADDFTGATDALAFLCNAGAQAVLFTAVPTNALLAKFKNLNAYGVAGQTRALPAAEMEILLQRDFKKMKATGAALVHYKVCSTFDSSAATGSIGKAIDCGMAVFKTDSVPVLGGNPALGRYCIFGNLFARMGTVTNGEVFRLDRHPSMKNHPVTPAMESDLQLVLAKQTEKPIGLINTLVIRAGLSPIKKETETLLQQNKKVILFDTFDTKELRTIGKYLCTNRSVMNATLFVIGSSAVAFAVGSYLNQSGIWKPQQSWPSFIPANPLLVLSGSCSPVTKKQIEFALQHGFVEIKLTGKTMQLHSHAYRVLLQNICTVLLQNKKLIVHTGKTQTKKMDAKQVGRVLGSIVQKVLDKMKLQRVVFAGGDTSSYAARAAGIKAVQMLVPFVPGAPLCSVVASAKKLNGLEVNFKGGQVGNPDYFTLL